MPYPTYPQFPTPMPQLYPKMQAQLNPPRPIIPQIQQQQPLQLPKAKILLDPRNYLHNQFLTQIVGQLNLPIILIYKLFQAIWLLWY